MNKYFTLRSADGEKLISVVKISFPTVGDLSKGFDLHIGVGGAELIPYQNNETFKLTTREGVATLSDRLRELIEFPNAAFSVIIEAWPDETVRVSFLSHAVLR